MKRVLIDTDMLGDDALAVLLGIASEDVEIEGITTVFGRASVEEITRRTLALLQIAGSENINVAKGLGRPLIRDPRNYIGHGCQECKACFERIDYFSKLERLESSPYLLKQKGVDFLVSKIMDNPGELSLLVLGPMTNIAAAITMEPRIVENVKELVIMAGAVFVPGNVGPRSGMNCYWDPEAAKIVFNEPWKIVLVPLDVSLKTLLQRDHLAPLKNNGTPLAKFVSDVVSTCIDYQTNKRKMVAGFPMHDPLAMGVLINREFVKTKKATISVETLSELTLGATVAKVAGISSQEDETPFKSIPEEKYNVDVCLEVNAEAFNEYFIDQIAKFR